MKIYGYVVITPNAALQLLKLGILPPFDSSKNAFNDFEIPDWYYKNDFVFKKGSPATPSVLDVQ